MLEAVLIAFHALPATLRRQWALLVPLMIVVAGAEVGAAAALVLMFFPQQAPQSIAATLALVPASVDPLAAMALLMLAIFVVRTIASAMLLWQHGRLVAASIGAVFNRIVRMDLSEQWSEHLRVHSNSRVWRATTATDVAYRQVLSSAAQLLAEIVVALALIGAVGFMAPASLLIVPVILLASTGVVVSATRGVTARIGGESYRSGEQVQRQLHELHRAMKTVKALHRERPFHQRIAAAHVEAMTAMRRHLVMLPMPRLIIELAFVAAVAAVIVTVRLFHGDVDLMPLLALFGYAGFRLVPAANRIVSHIDQIRHGAHGVQQLAETLRGDVELGTLQRVRFTRTIDVIGVSVAYAAGGLKDVNITVRCGELLGISGASGAGKTTLLDVISGLVIPDRGDLLVDGCAIDPSLHRISAGYVPERPILLDATIRENVVFGEIPDEERLRRAVVDAGLADVVARLPEGVETGAGEAGSRLSAGERQRVAIARALYADPDLLLLDEPTASLDRISEASVLDALRSMRGKRTIIVVTHSSAVLDLCDRTIHVHEGRVVDELERGEARRGASDLRIVH